MHGSGNDKPPSRPPDETGSSDGARTPAHDAPVSGPGTPRPLAGDRVRLESSGGEGAHYGRVEAVSGDTLSLRLDPECADRLPVAGDGRLVLGRGEGAWVFRVSVIACPQPDQVVLRCAGCAEGRLQRREYFRLAARLPLVVALPADPPELAQSEERPDPGKSPQPGEPAEPRVPPGRDSASDAVEAGLPPPAPRYHIFPLADLSGGGCFCLDPEEVLEVGLVLPARLDLGDGDPPLSVTAEVVRRGEARGEGGAGLRFLDLPEKNRERIMRALFREFRERRFAPARLEDPDGEER